MDIWKAKIFNNNQKIIQVSGKTPRDVLEKLGQSVNEKDNKNRRKL